MHGFVTGEKTADPENSRRMVPVVRQKATTCDLCASVDGLLAALPPDRALRAWMDRFADYVAAKREMADTLRAVFAAGGFSCVVE